MSYEAIEKVDLCKYAKVISLEKPIECKYKNTIIINGMSFSSCPADSGTDRDNNGKCAEVHLKEINE